ncbi:unnamed protein product [Gordionus sp. m RMFG-2023]
MVAKKNSENNVCRRCSDSFTNDYFRILRYLRFYGKISDKENNHYPKSIKTYTENGQDLAKIPVEQIWSKLKMIGAGNYVYPLLNLILETIISRHVGLLAACNAQSLLELSRGCEETKGLNNPLTILAAFLTYPSMCDQQLKLSNS